MFKIFTWTYANCNAYHSVLCDSSRDSDSSPVFFTLTRTQKSWLVPESRPSPSSSGRAVLRCLLWHSIHFVVCFHVLGDNFFLNMWTTSFMTRTRNLFLTRTLRWCCCCCLGLLATSQIGLGLWGDDSDSDSEVMTRTRIWQPGLGHSTDIIWVLHY